MKKICCFICIFCIIITIIPIKAHAEIVVDDLIETYITWFIDTGSNMLNMTPEDLIDYCNTPEGCMWLLTVWSASGGMENIFFNPGGDAMLAVKDANDARYLSYKIQKNLLQNLANNYNGYCNDVNRNLIPGNYIVQPGYSLRTDFGYVDGSPPYVGDSFNLISVWFHPTAFYDDTVQVYKGSYLSPPVIYVPSTGALKFCGVSLRAGYYIPCSDTQLFYLGNDDITYKIGWYNDEIYNTNTQQWGYRLLYYRGYSNAPRFLDTGISNSMQDYDTGIYTYEYLYDKLTKAVGLYLNLNNRPWIELPPDNDFDSDDTITMLLPIDEPAPPIYIPNDEYNNMITNNYYTYDNDVTNNNVTENDIQNIYNILYNSDTDTPTGGGSYDDSTLLQTLRNYFNQIVGYLKDIKDLLTERKQAEENVGSDDTPFTIPALTKMTNLFSTLQSSITDDNLTPPVFKIRIMDYEKNIDFSWFSPDSTIYWVIRRLLETSIYIHGLLYILSLIKSFVGLNSSQ